MSKLTSVYASLAIRYCDWPSNCEQTNKRQDAKILKIIMLHKLSSKKCSEITHIRNKVANRPCECD